MQVKSILTVLSLILIISIIQPVNSFAQRNPTVKLTDDRIQKRVPDKNETKRPKEDETIIRERPKQTQNPKVETPPPDIDYNKPPKYHPEPPYCYDPPYRPNPHPTTFPDPLIINYKISGIEKFNLGEFNIALEYLTIAINQDSDDYELYYYKGMTEIELQLYEEALEDMDFYLDHIIHEPDGYFQRDRKSVV